jgi:hypothetical protein
VATTIEGLNHFMKREIETKYSQTQKRKMILIQRGYTALADHYHFQMGPGYILTVQYGPVRYGSLKLAFF